MTTKEIQNIGEKALSALKSLLKNKMPENIISIEKEKAGWKIIAEVLERKSIPDTEDILGRYELMFDGKGELIGYKQVMLRRRSQLEEQKKTK